MANADGGGIIKQLTRMVEPIRQEEDRDGATHRRTAEVDRAVLVGP
ncbi:hypothetical protein [Streptomyces bicolor]|nr:hypothetical protein [Streptomyces bicolor]